MKLNELQVDVKKLLERAQFAGWGPGCVNRLWSIAGQPVPADWDKQKALPMERVSYVSMAERINGYGRLALVDSLAGIDTARASGTVLLMMAREFFLPWLPERHAARLPTEELLGVLGGYLDGSAPAERYIAQAFHYRIRFNAPYPRRVDADSAFEALLEAMPSDGLDCAAAHGYWGLSGHWTSFGRFLAAQDERWSVLDALAEEAKDVEFVEADADYDEEAHDTLYGLIDAQRDDLVTEALTDDDAQLMALVDRTVAAFCGDPDAAPVPDYIERLRAERAARHTPRTDAQEGAIPPAFLEAARQRRAASRCARQPDAYQGDRPADAPAPEAAPTDPEAHQQGEADPAPGLDAAI